MSLSPLIAPARRVASLALVGLFVAACGSGAATPSPAAPTAGPTEPAATAAATPAAPAATPTSAPAAGPVVVGSASTSAGTVLVGPTGMTLYTRSGDTATTSSCTAGCLSAWPALVVPSGGTVSAGTGVTGTLATFTRADDSSTQVTYNGKPLYYFASDAKAGDVTGDGVGGFSIAKP